jgi:hypothetical protein
MFLNYWASHGFALFSVIVRHPVCRAIVLLLFILQLVMSARCRRA